MTDRGVPRFVKLIAVGVVVGLVVVLGAAWYISDIRKAEERHDCERSVAGRADNRAMWEWLAQKFPEGAQESDLANELDRLLPELRCDGSDPVPVEEK